MAAAGAFREGGNRNDVWDAAVQATRQNWHNLTHGENIGTPRQQYIGGKDMMARRLTGNPDATALSLRQGARRAEQMNYNQLLDNAYNNVAAAENNLEAAQNGLDTANIMAQQFQTSGFDGLTNDQQEHLLGVLNTQDSERLLDLYTSPNRTPAEEAEFNELSTRAVYTATRNANQGVEHATNDLNAARAELEELRNIEDNLGINRTPEFTTNVEPNHRNTATGQYGASGTRANIRYGRHGGHREYREAREHRNG